MVELGLKLTLAYLIGSVIGSLVVGYFRGGVDIRTVGSGNAGGTNALRTQGKAFAFWVMVIDIGKGILAAAVIPDLDVPGVGFDPEIDRGLVLYGVAFAAIVGHVFPIWFGFRGGKGGATAAGLVLYLAPSVGIAVIGVWLVVRRADRLRRSRDDQRRPRGRRRRRPHAAAGRARPVCVRVLHRRAPCLYASRQHPPDVERHGVALLAARRQPPARRQMNAPRAGSVAPRARRR